MGELTAMETLSVDQEMKVYKGGGCNSIVLYSRNGKKAIIVDTKYLRGAKELRKKVTAQEITVINTHFHLDHARGNRYYPDAFVISGSTNWKQWDFDTADSKRPDRVLTAGETVHLECDDEIIDVMDMGPAHSPNDIVVYFEKRKVLAAGDLIWVNMHPVLLDGNTNLGLWKGYLDRLDKDFNIEMVVPGHGDISGKNAILDMKSYFASIEGALGDNAKMKELKAKYGTYKKFPLFGSLRRTGRLLAKGKEKK
jgi:cyclase